MVAASFVFGATKPLSAMTIFNFDRTDERTRVLSTASEASGAELDSAVVREYMRLTRDSGGNFIRVAAQLASDSEAREANSAGWASADPAELLRLDVLREERSHRFSGEATQSLTQFQTDFRPEAWPH
jgi:hypothetical protein